MAGDFKQVIEIAIQSVGDENVRALLKSLRDLGDSAELSDEQLSGLTEELDKLGKETAQAAGLQKSIGAFKELGRSVLDTEKNIASAKSKVAELGKAISETAEPTKRQVKEFEAARRELGRLEGAQQKQRSTLSSLKAGFAEAGLSTRNLVAAEKELAARMQASQASMAGLATSARATVAARQQAAQAEQALLQQLRNTVAQQQQAARASENLQRARELLAQRSQSAGATERGYAQALGTSAAKIAAIGAAAVGITSGVQLARSGLDQLIATAGKFQQLDVQLDSVFGDQSTEALEEIQKFAQETPFQLQQVSDAFVKLKAFGLDPLDGTFDAISDQASKLGGSQETLTGITLALGQAWAKQKLQGEEILQLVERGVPVWDLLSRATGKSVQELQKLSEAGKLGRTEIKALIEQIGVSADGASERLADTLPGQINRLKGQWSEFLNLIANSGVLDYLQEQLAAVSEEVERMAASGELQAWAQEIAESIVGAAQAIKGVTMFLVDHREAIIALAAAYAGFKAVSLIGGLATAFAGLATRVVASTTALAAGTTATTAMLGPLGLLAAALAFTANATFNLVDAMQKVKEVNAEVAAAERELQLSNERLVETSREKQAQYAAFADVVIAKSTELAQKSETDTQAYINQLQGAIEYTQALGLEAIATGDNVAKIAARNKLAELRPALEAARAQMVEVREASMLAFETVGRVGIEAAEKFDELISKGKSAKEAVDGIFKDVDFTRAEGLANAAAQIAAIGARGTEAAAVVRDELRAQILRLSDEDFSKFKNAAAAAFGSTFQGAEQLKESLAGINLERLGVDIEEIKTGFSSTGKIAVEAFQGARAEVDSLGLTAQQRAKAIGQAFDEALGKAKTQSDIRALGDELVKAFDAGELGIDAYMARLDQVQAKVAGIGQPSQGGGDAGKQAFEQATTAVADLGTQAEAAGGKVEESSGQIGNAAKFIQDTYQSFANELGKTSDAAVQRFTVLTRRIFELGAGIADFSGLARFGKAVEDAYAIVNAEIAKQRDGVAALAQSYGELTDAALQAMINSRGGVDNLSAGLVEIAEAARNGQSEFALLGAQDLGPLASSADAVAERVRQIGEAAKESERQLADMASSFQDQIDQINGDQAAIENRRFQQDLERLEELRRATGEAQNSEYNQAVAAAERLHQLKLSQIREQEQARRESDSRTSGGASSNAGSSPRPAGNSGNQGNGASGGFGGVPVNINLNGQTVPVNVNNQGDLNRLIALLRQAMQGSGAGGSLIG